jgi:hypothetical protein
MLTSFFGKSNPVNYLIIGTLIGIGYLLINLFGNTFDFDVLLLVKQIVLAGLSVFMMLLLDFIIRKNNLTGKSTYGIFIFAGYMFMVPSIFENGAVMIAVICTLFAIRRVFSIPSEKNIEKKILDATLWIALASFFYFYSLIFILVLYFAILRRPQTSFRYLFIPPLGLFAMFLIVAAWFYMAEDSLAWIADYTGSIGMDFNAYNSFQLLIPTALFVTLTVWIVMYRLFKISAVKRKERPNYVVLIVLLIASLFVAMGANQKDGSELLFLIPILAIATTEYLEKRKELYVKEGFLWMVVMLPIGLLFI